jgi:hypothetical protein
MQLCYILVLNPRLTQNAFSPTLVSTIYIASFSLMLSYSF